MTTLTATAALAYLTEDMPGTGGIIRQRPDDFCVEEQPLEDLAGKGEHLYLYIEKRKATTIDVARRLAKLFRVSRQSVSYAGLKDKHAVTRQQFSIHLPDASDDQKLLARINYTKLNLLWSDRHTRKLRRGQLKCNRFVIYIRNVDPTRVVHAKRIVDRMIDSGVPNFIGDQRFGYRQNNARIGRAMLLGEWQEMLDELLGRPGYPPNDDAEAGRNAYDCGDYHQAIDLWPRKLRYDRQVLDALRQGKSPEDAVMTMDWHQRGFLFNALQSGIFNRALDRRLREGSMGTLLAGDVAFGHADREMFVVDEETARIETAPGGRVHRQVISPSGPMWGADMLRAAGKVAEAELDALHEYDLTESDRIGMGKHPAMGSRRPLRVPLINPDLSGGVDRHGPYIRIAFDLSRGSFATVVLREIMKRHTDEPVNDNDE